MKSRQSNCKRDVAMKEYLVEGGALQYEVSGAEATIVGASALLIQVEIPPTLEGKPVTRIDKKAFLSKKYIKRVILPDSITSIGDWAFGYCDRLEEIILPDRDIIFGKNVFLEDKQLKNIAIRGQEESYGRLMAAAMCLLQAEYLLRIPEVGSDDWFAKWDARMLSLLAEDDAEGYSGQVLCGEEDYGSTNFGAYINKRRRRKVRILLERLLYPVKLQHNLREKLVSYLANHTKGCETEETWQVILEEHGTEKAYFDLFVSLGLLTKENRGACINDMGDQVPEMKAYFLAQFQEDNGAEAFFDGLDL